MAKQQRRPERAVKCAGLVILFLFAAAGAFAREYSPLQVKIDKTEISIKERIRFTVTVDYPDYHDIEIIEPADMGDLGIYSGPAKRTIVEDSANGLSSIYKSTFTWTFRSSSTGRKVIPPFTFIINGKNYSTEPVLVAIGLKKRKKLYIPYEAYWSPAFTEAYVGEAIPVSLYVKNEPQIGLFPKIRTAAPNGGFWEEVTGLGQIEQEEMAGTIVYTIPVSGYIFTPSRDGRLVIHSAEIETDASEGMANSVIINVKPIPEEINSTGAIGRMEYSWSVDRNEAHRGEEIILKIQVSGTGNLNYLQIPEPDFANLEFLESRRIENIKAFPGGYTGIRTEEFIYQTTAEGRAAITVFPFPSLDRESGGVQVSPGAEISINVLPQLSVSSVNKNKFFLVSRDKLEDYTRRELFNDPINYLLLLPGVISLLLAALLKKKKPVTVFFLLVLFLSVAGGTGTDSEPESWSMYYGGDFFSAGKSFYRQAVQQGDNAALFYNASLSFFKAGETGKAVAILRKAIFLDPHDTGFRELSEEIEKSHSLPFQEAEIISVHPDLFFIIFLITWNLSCAAYTVAFFRKSSILVIILIFLTICTAVSLTGMLSTIGSRGKDTGIIRYDATKVKKIPRGNSSASYLLNSGQTLSLEGFSDPYYLIETKNGITGWLHKNDLYVDAADIQELLDEGDR